MAARLIIVSGTGTEIGKTHFAEALILAWGRVGRVVGLKPLESGVDENTRTDAARLAAASTFHVKQDAYSFAAPISPHLAARDAGVEIRCDVVARVVREARQKADCVVLELAGGLFSPLARGLHNADLSRALSPDFLLLVAPDRLGVLHDVVATSRAASAMALRVAGIILVTPHKPDASTGRNAPELPDIADVPVLAVLPRASPAELSELPAITHLVEMLRK